MPIEKKDVKIGMRVQDSNANVGTVVFFQRLEKAMHPPDGNVGTYAAVQFDHPHGGLRRGDGTLGGKRLVEAPPGTIEFIKPGNLFPEMNTAGIAAVRARFGDRIAHMHDALIVKFLIARKFDLPKVFEMIEKQLKWVAEFKPSCNEYFPPQMAEDYPIGFGGFDREGNLLYFERPGNGGKCTPVNFVKKYGLGVIVRWHVNMMEMGREKLRQLGYKQRITTIVDLKDLGESDSSTVKFGKLIAAIDQDYYPEHLSKLFLINAPLLFTGLWKLVSVFVDARTKEKIHIHGKDYRPHLEKYIDPSQLPSFCGGTNDEWLAAGGVCGGKDPSLVAEAKELDLTDEPDPPAPSDSPAAQQGEICVSPQEAQ